jgi:hypothetical protein
MTMTIMLIINHIILVGSKGLTAIDEYGYKYSHFSCLHYICIDSQRLRSQVRRYDRRTCGVISYSVSIFLCFAVLHLQSADYAHNEKGQTQ